MHISSCTLVSLALSARAVAELTCGVSNGYDLGNPAYYYNDKDNLANFDACSATCKADSKCQSFAFGNSACLLYTEKLAANFREQLDSPYLFYDRNCLNIKSTPTAAPPPPESTTPPAATPTATQPATGASGASGASGVDTKPADASSAQPSPTTTDAAANSPSATNNAGGAAGASATTAAAEGTLVPAYLGASSGAASTATSASTLVTSSVSSSTRTSSATSSSGSTQASGSSTAASSADSGASELTLGTWWSAVLVSVSLLAVFV